MLKFKSKIIWYSIYLIVIVTLNLTNYLFLAVNDDFVVLNLLRSGVSETLILSYPMSFLISNLYSIFPLVPWYSFLLMSGICLAIWAYIEIVESIFKRINESKNKLIVVHLLGLLIHIYLLLNISLTSVSVWLFMVSVLHFFINGNKVYLIGFSLLLRLDVVIGLIPLFLLAYCLFRGKEIFEKNSLRQLAIFGGLILIIGFFHFSSPPEDYKDWVKWNTSRAYFYDYQQNPNNSTTLDSTQLHILKGSWWSYDEKMIPSNEVIKSAGNKGLIALSVVQNVTSEKFNKLLNEPLNNTLWSLLLLAVFMIVSLRKVSLITRLGSIFLFLFLILLVLIRDVHRVTGWVLIGANLVVWMKYFLHKSTDVKAKIFYLLRAAVILIFAYRLIVEIPKSMNYNFEKQSQSIVNKAYFKKLKEKYNKSVFMPSIQFPHKIGLPDPVYLGSLFEEDEFLRFDNVTGIGPFGWMSRHPYFYEFYEISTPKITRKYASFYDFIISDQTYFIGYGLEQSDEFLEYYNSICEEGLEHEIISKKFGKLSLMQFKLIKK